MVNFDYSMISVDVFEKFILNGLIFSIYLTVIATIGGIAIGTILALMRLSSYGLLRLISKLYVNLMRSIPLPMVLLWFFLVFPIITGANIGAEKAAIVTFIAFEAAYFSEIVRSGLHSVKEGQVNAGKALGLNYWQNLRLIILPQALQNMLPVFITQTIILFQDTSMVYVIGAYDLLKGFELAGNNHGRTIEAYIMAALVYLLICCSLSYAAKQYQNRVGHIAAKIGN